jgi:hypothetical protein
MAKYRNAMAQSKGDFFLTDGGIETTLIFLEAKICLVSRLFTSLRRKVVKRASEGIFVPKLSWHEHTVQG